MKDLAELMGSTVTVLNSVSRDKYGKRTYEASGMVISPCRVQASSDLIRDAEGKEVVVTGKVYALGDVDVRIGDKVILDDGSSPVIASVSKNNDENGDVDHTVIYLTNG